MVSTIAQAQKHGMKIQRETRWYGVDKNGVQYRLEHDWTIERLDRELIDKHLKELGK